MSDVVGTAAVTIESDASQLAASIADELNSQVTPALDQVLSTLTQIESGFGTIGSEVASFASELDALEAPAIEIDADVSQAEDAIAGIAEVDEIHLAFSLSELEEAIGLVDELDGSEPIITPVVDTAAAQEQAASLTESLDASGSSASGLRGSLDEVSASAVGAGGSIGFLGSQNLKTAAGLAGVTLGLGAVVSGTRSLIDESIAAESSMQSFEDRTGSAADEIERLTGASSVLGATQGELAIAVGSSDEELRSATARLFSLGEAEGFSAERSDELIENVVDLATRARVLNPELGSLGEITNTLGTRLQRGGRFTADFGISLTVAEINARALANTGKTVAAELTLLEKTEAAAQVATEQLGSSLGEDIAAGADNAAISLASLQTRLSEALEPLGAPLIEPFFAILESGAPIIEDVATVLADVADVALTAFEPVIDALAPLVDIWRENQQEILGELKPAIVELGEALGELVIAVTPLIEEFADAFVELAPLAADVIGVLADGVSVVADFADAIGQVVEHYEILQELLPNIPNLDFGDSGTEAEAEAQQVLLDAMVERAAATAQLTEAETEALIASRTNADGVVDYAAVMDALAVETALLGVTLAEETRAENEVEVARLRAAEAAREGADAVADQIAALQSVTSSLAEIADVTVEWADAQAIAEEREEAVRKGIEGQITALESQKAALTAQGAAVDEYNQAQQEQVDALKALEAEAQQAFSSIIGEADSFRAVLSEAEGLAKDRAQELADAASEIGSGFDGLAVEADASLADFREVIETNLADTAAFIDDIQSLIARGAGGLASFLLQQGEGAASAADEAAGLTDAQLAEQERFIEESERRNDAQVSLVESLVDRLDGIEPPEPILITFDTEAAVATLDAQIQSLRDQAAGLDFEATAADFEEATLRRLDESERFFIALQTLNDRGADDLEAYFAEQGIISLAAAEEAARVDDKELRRRETFVESIGSIQSDLLEQSEKLSAKLLLAGSNAGSDYLEGLLDELESGNPEVQAAILDLFGITTGTKTHTKEGLASLGGFENGGIITTEGFFRGGEGGKPEVVVPLTDEPRARELSRLSGLDRILGSGAAGGSVTTIGPVILNVDMPPGATRADGAAFGEALSEGFVRRLEVEIGVG